MHRMSGHTQRSPRAQGRWGSEDIGEAAEELVVAGPALQACVPAQLPGLSLFLSELLRLPCSLVCSPCSVSGPGSQLRTDAHPCCMNFSKQSPESSPSMREGWVWVPS